MVPWGLKLWARGFFPPGFSIRVGSRTVTLCPLAAAFLVGFQSRRPSGMPEQRLQNQIISPVLSHAPDPKNTSSKGEHPVSTVATSAHTLPLTAAWLPRRKDRLLVQNCP